MFYERSASLTKEIKTHSSAKALESPAHSLKSSAGALGLIALSHACEKLEIACKQDTNEQGLNRLSAALLELYASSIDKLLSTFKEIN